MSESLKEVREKVDMVSAGLKTELKESFEAIGELKEEFEAVTKKVDAIPASTKTKLDDTFKEVGKKIEAVPTNTKTKFDDTFEAVTRKIEAIPADTRTKLDDALKEIGGKNATDVIEKIRIQFDEVLPKFWDANVLLSRSSRHDIMEYVEKVVKKQSRLIKKGLSDKFDKFTEEFVVEEIEETKRTGPQFNPLPRWYVRDPSANEDIRPPSPFWNEEAPEFQCTELELGQLSPSTVPIPDEESETLIAENQEDQSVFPVVAGRVEESMASIVTNRGVESRQPIVANVEEELRARIVSNRWRKSRGPTAVNWGDGFEMDEIEVGFSVQPEEIVSEAGIQTTVSSHHSPIRAPLLSQASSPSPPQPQSPPPSPFQPQPPVIFPPQAENLPFEPPAGLPELGFPDDVEAERSIKRIRIQSTSRLVDIGYAFPKVNSSRRKRPEVMNVGLPETVEKLILKSDKEVPKHRANNTRRNKNGAICWLSEIRGLEEVVWDKEDECDNCKEARKRGEEVACFLFETAKTIRVYKRREDI